MTPLHVMVKRLLACWDSADDDQLATGRMWYPQAKEEARRISKATGVTHRRVVRVIAAVSPRTRWHVNLRVAEAICADEPTHGIGIFLDRGRAEAQGIRALSGRKSSDFDLAIWGKADVSPCDRWTGSLVFGEMNATQKRMIERVGAHDRVYRAHEVAADLVGTTPAVMQATTWGVYRGAFA